MRHGKLLRSRVIILVYEAGTFRPRLLHCARYHERAEALSLIHILEKRDELDEDFGSDLADASPQERKQALEADEKREQAKQAFLDALEKNPSLMMTTAGSSFEGWRVTEYRGTLSTDAVVGAGLPAEADAIVSDLTDQRSLLLGSKMERDVYKRQLPGPPPSPELPSTYAAPSIRLSMPHCRRFAQGSRRGFERRPTRPNERKPPRLGPG